MASGTFATLIKLIPLDSSDNSYDKLPEQLAAKKAGAQQVAFRKCFILLLAKDRS